MLRLYVWAGAVRPGAAVVDRDLTFVPSINGRRFLYVADGAHLCVHVHSRPLVDLPLLTRFVVVHCASGVQPPGDQREDGGVRAGEEDR